MEAETVSDSGACKGLPAFPRGRDQESNNLLRSPREYQSAGTLISDSPEPEE
jgi:hypothetical protein